MYAFIAIPIWAELTVIGLFFLFNLILSFIFGGLDVIYVIMLVYTIMIFIVAAAVLVMRYFNHKVMVRHHKYDMLSMIRKRVKGVWYVSGIFIMCYSLLVFFPFHLIVGEQVYPISHGFWHLGVGIGVSFVFYSMHDHIQTKQYRNWSSTWFFLSAVCGIEYQDY